LSTESKATACFTTGLEGQPVLRMPGSRLRDRASSGHQKQARVRASGLFALSPKNKSTQTTQTGISITDNMEDTNPASFRLTGTAKNATVLNARFVRFFVSHKISCI